ncbi:ABC transporter permease [Paenibacillus nasutitermitis]|uniref:Sugar ABC transporter permease n=1 Tax=Paenibacillus nasutitermitis TaxID=1652958 RepID=A0A916Z1T2_9BACL|nr:ABC transporter permease subunit [Paenibacillus nasutitermitis]GGD72690.1 sugar ABC transporter permease [Paenibacillus nasutitermitis]
MKRSFFFNLPLHLLLLPAVILVLIYSYGPMLGIVIAFQKFIPAKGFFESQFVGWKNFEYVFHLSDFPKVMINTLFISIMKIIAGLFVPLAVSLMLNEVRQHFFKRSVQTLIYLPHFLSWVILGGVLIDILSPSTGIVNSFIGIFGIEPIYFLGDNSWFPFVTVLSDVWKEFGFSTIVYLAALTGINPSMYEAAIMDGAGRLRQTWHITLPGIRYMIVLLLTLSLGNVLNAGFDQIFNLYSPQVYESGDIIDTYVYRMGLISAQFGPATAVGLFKSVISLILISTTYYLAYRFAKYRIF